MLEEMVSSLLKQAASPGPGQEALTFEQKMAVGALALKVEAVRNKLSDEDYGAGFLEDPGYATPTETDQANAE